MTETSIVILFSVDLHSTSARVCSPTLLWLSLWLCWSLPSFTCDSAWEDRPVFIFPLCYFLCAHTGHVLNFRNLINFRTWLKRYFCCTWGELSSLPRARHPPFCFNRFFGLCCRLFLFFAFSCSVRGCTSDAFCAHLLRFSTQFYIVSEVFGLC